MQVIVMLFAGVAERLGTDAVTVELPTGTIATAGSLKARLMDLYPEAAALIGTCFVAKNQAYAEDGEPISASDELALIPPVSGGSPSVPEAHAETERYALTDGPIDLSAVTTLVADPGHGATLVFVGTTREWMHGRRTVRLEYEAYRPMALRAMRDIGDETGARWPGAKCAIIHRLGTVGIGEASVAIAVSSPHREAAYEASRYAIERLKQIVPIWKKEVWEDGSEWKGHQTGPWNPLDGKGRRQ